MDASGPTVSLRPLGIGEVLDRAVTLCVKFFVPLLVVYVVFAVPYGIVAFYGAHDYTQMVTALGDAMRTSAGHPARSPADLQRELAGIHGGPSLVLLGIAAFFVAPLAQAALIEMISADYLGRPTSFAQAYGAALARWLPLVGINLLFAVLGVFAYLAAIVVGLFLGVAVAIVAHFVVGLGIALGVIFGLTYLLALLAFGVLAVLTWYLSYMACVVEKMPSAGAFTTAVRRVFRSLDIRRSLLFGFAFLAIVFGIALLSLAGTVGIAELVHSDVVVSLFQIVLSIVSSIFSLAVLCVFYFDLRVREEGLDLQLAARTIAPAI